MSRYELEVLDYIKWCTERKLNPKNAINLSKYCKEKNNERKEK